MVVKDGDIIRLDYTGFDEKKEVFDTTVEKKAVDAGIYDKNRKYKPSVAVIGEKNFFDKVDEEIKKAEKGKKLEITLAPKDSFGERNAEHIKMVPLKEFKKQKLMPFPGMPVEVNDMHGRVQTVSGGRVRVDFNHPLAGKTVCYELEVKEIITDKEEKVKALLEKYFPFTETSKINYNLKGEELEIVLPEQAQQNSMPLRKAFAETALKHTAIKKIRFVEEYAKQAEKKADKEASKEPAKEKTAEK